jgi:hypothetical protein
MQEHADNTRHTPGGKALHTGPHRRGERQPEEQQEEKQPQVPESERAGDDTDHDH